MIIKDIEKLIIINNKVYEATEKQLKKYDVSKVKDLSLMALSYNLSFRFISLLKSVNIFLEIFKEDINAELQIAILYRPALLDIINYKYVTELYQIGNKMEDLNEATRRMIVFLLDNFNKYQDENKTLFSKGIIDKKTFDSTKQIISSLIDKYYPEFQNIDLKAKHPNLKTIFKNFVNSDEKMINIAYHNYSYYSKYEHFGILTTLIQDSKKSSIENKIYRMNQSTLVILNCIMSTFYYINLDIKQLVEIKDKFY